MFVDEINELRCSHCDKEFKYESEKKRHELSHFPRFQCEICNKKFSFISALKRHEKQHLRKGKVQCKQCNRKFRDDSLLKRHVDYAHKGKCLCDICYREFHSELALSTHKKIHKAKSERKYQCDYTGCEKTFNFRHHLKHHESTHTNYRQYCCPKCNKGFIQYQHLKSHMKVHEPEKWLPCIVDQCKKKFVTEYSRKRHLLGTHGKEIDEVYKAASVDDRANKILCTQCGELVDEHLFKEHVNSTCSIEFCDPSEISKVNGENLDENTNVNNDNTDIVDCKSALGHCIMNTDSEENCLCAQIKATVDDYQDNNLMPNENVNTTNIHTDLQAKGPYKHENYSFKEKCQTCDCNSNMNFNYLDNYFEVKTIAKQNKAKCTKLSSFAQSKINDSITIVEYTNSGIIKLKETFDSDIDLFDNNTLKPRGKEGNDILKSNCVPYNSCKAVLGKCIVSGNGTIGEECLCAKMLNDDDPHMTAQEIDEITPRPVSQINYL